VPKKATRETLLLRRLKAGKGGKVVTEISGFESANNLRLLLKELQRELATGGALKDKVIEVQGDRLDEVRGLLEGRGFRVKGS
jgi:translation initiation factor 1